MFRLLKFDTIYYTYLNESLVKYYISMGGLRLCLFCLFSGGGAQNSGKPAYIILARSLRGAQDKIYNIPNFLNVKETLPFTHYMHAFFFEK